MDAAYYTFLRQEYLLGLSDQVPDDFRFGFKVTDHITIKKFPNHARHGAKGVQVNQVFLNADLFATAFLKPCEEIRSKIGVLIFEFSRFTEIVERVRRTLSPRTALGSFSATTGCAIMAGLGD